MPRKYNLNICRSGETSRNYIVPTTNNSAAGSYTCSVTISKVVSTDSTGYAVTATGLFFEKAFEVLSWFVCTERTLPLRRKKVKNALLIPWIKYKVTDTHDTRASVIV